MDIEIIKQLLNDEVKKKQILELLKQDILIENQSYGLLFDNIPEIFNNKDITLYDDFKLDNFDNKNFTMIQGENYFVLKCLQEKFSKKIDVIYIDPPYNTGSKDFKYNDKYVEKDDRDRHSRWLSFMDKRIFEAKKLLNNDGCLILSIGEDELNNIGILLKKYFKFVSEPIIWLSKSEGNNNKTNNITNTLTDYVYIAYDNPNFKTNMETLELNDNSEMSNKKKERYPLGIFLNHDISEYREIIIDNKKYKIIPKNEYQIKEYEEESYKSHRFQKRTAQEGHGSWRYKTQYETIKQIINEDDFLLAIMDVKDKQNLGLKFQLNNNYFQSISDKIEVKMPNFLGQYQGGYKNFQTAKPIELIKRLIKNTSKKDSLILDFFAGSGTTLIATHLLNIEDKGNRQCIIVTNNENDIFNDITVPRILNYIPEDELSILKLNIK